MTMLELHHAILEHQARHPTRRPCPISSAKLMSRLGWLPGAPLTRDQWLMLRRGSVPAGGHPGLEAFGIRQTPLAAVGGEWLSRFRGKFAGRRIDLTATH